MANDSEFGLSSAVFGRDLARAWDVAGRIESGMCHVNGPTVHDEPQMPFGGMRDSMEIVGDITQPLFKPWNPKR